MDEQNRRPEDQWQRLHEDQKHEDTVEQELREPELQQYSTYASQPSQPSFIQVDAEDGRTVITPMTGAREYRPFTVSGLPPEREWNGKARPRTSFRAIIASFLVGILLMGGLMYAADQGNWFTRFLNNSTTTQSTGTNAQAVNNPVSSSPDVVRPNNIAQIFEQASPAVVQIETYANTRRSTGSSMWEEDFFRQFFGDRFNQNNGEGTGDDLVQSGMGSGFIFDSTGYILTNQHVIANADEIRVYVDGTEKYFIAELLGSSYELDLAVLKIEGSNFPTLSLGDSSGMNMGDWVVAIGNPYGFDHTVTVGVLSSNEREISIQDTNGTRNYKHLLQTDASINPGNSGGPLLNLEGEVIGINTAVSSQAQGIGFAIPTSTISEVLENLKTNTKIPQQPSPFIGATLVDMTEDIAMRLGIDAGTKGSFVREVSFNSPAYKADLRQYDVIVGMDGKKYDNSSALIEQIKAKSVGDKITLNINRGGNELDLSVTVGDRNEFEAQ